MSPFAGPFPSSQPGKADAAWFGENEIKTTSNPASRRSSKSLTTKELPTLGTPLTDVLEQPSIDSQSQKSTSSKQAISDVGSSLLQNDGNEAKQSSEDDQVHELESKSQERDTTPANWFAIKHNDSASYTQSPARHESALTKQVAELRGRKTSPVTALREDSAHDDDLSPAAR